MMPSFLITIDTEGDNLWASPSTITTENTKFLPRFQALCERFGFKPTYLTNYEMATDPEFVRFARDAESRGAAEVGMHLHAWHSPPDHNLTGNKAEQPYLIEYPTPILKAKIRDMTSRLEDRFGHKMVSHRAGRWAMDERYAETLIEEGYLVDCSVTPYVSWRSSQGGTQGGTDYRHFPDHPYFIDPTNISRPGNSPLLELPMTIIPRRPITSRALPASLYAQPLAQKIMNRVLPHDWLRPRRNNRDAMLSVIRKAVSERRSYIEFMTHSSELMPGGSPYFPTPDSIETLYADLEATFSEIARHFKGATLAEFRAGYRTENESLAA